MRKVRVTARRVWLAIATGIAVALALAALGADYASLLATRHDERALRRENAQLRTQLRAVEERVAHIAATLDRVDGLDAQLRAGTTALQPARGRSAAPATAPGTLPASKPAEVPAPGGRPAPRSAEVRTTAGSPASPLQLIPSHSPLDPVPVPSASRPARDATALAGLAALESAAARQEGALRSVQDYFEEQRALLAAVPSAWPFRGFVTSDFGDRLDPYTADRMMHRGLDIAAAPGTAIYAPSDATVSFAGTENGYGKVLILDHGNGVNTRYGHLSHIFVKAGERVASGERVATVGSTGRSTGPHLHYEVRVNGIAENPRKFILQ